MLVTGAEEAKTDSDVAAAMATVLSILSTSAPPAASGFLSFLGL